MNRLIDGAGRRKALLALAPALLAAEAPASAGEAVATVDKLHCDLLTIDSHIDVPRDFVDMDPARLLDGGPQFSLEKLKQGCLDVVFLVAAPGQDARNRAGYDAAWASTQRMIAGIHRLAELYPDRVELARTVADVERIAAGGRHAVLIGVENGYAIGKDLKKLRQLRDRGVAYLTLAHSGHSDLADSATPIRELGDPDELHRGVSAFGRDVIREMNRLGMMVDVSHLSRQAMLDAVRLSAAPVIASHSAATAVAPAARNLDDEQIRALAAKGGVVQIVGYSDYVRRNAPAKNGAIGAVNAELGLDSSLGWARASDALLADYGRRLTELDAIWPRASVADYVDHIDHVVKIAGIDHVGVGSDFYAGGGAGSGGLDGWMDVGRNRAITQELRRRQYSDADIARIWGGNLLRVMAAVEKVAAGKAD